MSRPPIGITEALKNLKAKLARGEGHPRILTHAIDVLQTYLKKHYKE